MFGKIVPVFLVTCALSGAADAATIWQENFSSYADVGITGQGPTTGYPDPATNNWNIDVSACVNLNPGSGSADDYFMAVDTSGGRMEARDIDGEAIWSSIEIDISAYNNVSLFVDTSETGGSANNAKYVEVYYKLDGSSEVAFEVNPTNTGNWGSATATHEDLLGSTVQIITRVNNPNAGDRSIFDNVTVAGDLISSGNVPPVLDPIGDQSLTVSNALNFSVTASDADDDPVILSASNLPPGAVFNTVTNIGSVTGQFNWASAEPIGVYTTTFYAIDGETNDSEEITITVTNAPFVSPPPTGAVWNVIYNLPQQSSSGTAHPEQYRIRNTLAERIDALQNGNSAILSTFTFSANEGAGTLINAMDVALDRGADISFIADSEAEISVIYGGTNSLLSLATRPVNPLNLVVDGSSNGIMHDKFALFDYGGTNRWVLTGSWNHTLAASADQWNITIEARSSSLYNIYTHEAAELLAGRFHDDPNKSHAHDGSTFTLDGSWGTNFVRFAPYPDDAIGGNNAERDITNLIALAQSEIFFALNKLNREPIRDALIAAANRGVAIQGVMPKSDTDSGGVSEDVYNALTNYVEFLPAYAKADYSALDTGEPNLVHAKTMVIDPNSSNAIVIHGSANWTAQALVNDNDNDENTLFLRHNEIAAQFYEHFQRITASGTFSSGNSTVVEWDFESSDQASGGIPANETQTVARVPAPPAYDAISGNLSCNGWNDGAGTKYWKTSFSTEQHTDIKVSSIQTASSTGPADFKLQYKVGTGGTYTDLAGATVTVPNGNEGILTRIPLPAACNNQPSIFLRWIMTSNISAGGGTVFSVGKGRIEEIFVDGQAYDQPPVLDPIGDQTVFEGDDLSFIVTASDPVDNDPVTLSASNLPPGSVFTGGLFSWSTASPAGVYTSTFYAVDKDGVDSETITISALEKPLVMITELADPAGTGGGNYRFIELYNAGSNTIDLTSGNWHLSQQANGNTWNDIPLNGSIASKDTWLIAYDAIFFQEAYGFAPDQQDTGVNGTGNDAWFLYYGDDHTSGVLIDIYGEFDTDGEDTAWEYKDSRAGRNSMASGPNTIWTALEWDITPGATTNEMNPGEAYNLPPVLDPIGDQNVIEGQSLSFTVTASDPADNDPFILSATGLPTGSAFVNDTFTWNPAVPAGIYYVTFTATDKDGSTSEIVTITVFEKPILLISEIADPDGTGGDAYRFVELYNAGDAPIDLAAGNWYLSLQKSGNDDWNDIPLSGIIPVAKTYVIAKSRDDFLDAYGFLPDQVDSDVDGNGDDAYFLYYQGHHNIGVLIDIYGELDTDGSDTDWEYTDGQAERIESILEPNNLWMASEWTISSAGTEGMSPGRHGPVPQLENLDDPFVFSGGSLSFTVTASNSIDPSDPIVITVDNLPAGASFVGGTGTGSATGLFSWNTPPDGIYYVTFVATGKNGTSEDTVKISVSDHSTLKEWFYRWKGKDSIYELANGQFWQQTSREIYGNYGLYQPDANITKSGSDYRMTLEDVSGSITVQLLKNVIESRVRKRFGGYEPSRIIELSNGQFWRQTSSEISSRNDSLQDALLWRNGSTYHMKVEGEEEIVSVEQMDIIKSDITSLFTGLARNRIYQLEDGTTWKQVSNESISSSANPATAWRWVENGSTWIYFVDDDNLKIGTCRVESTDPPENPPIVSRIDSWFRGWKGERVFALQNGQFWQQTTPRTVEQTLSNPQVIITYIPQTGAWEMRVENALPPAYINVRQLHNVTSLTIDGWFYGFKQGNFLRLSNDSWWRQTSRDLSTYQQFEPDILLWNDAGTDRIEMPDNALTIEVEQLNVLLENTITNNFTGLDYGNLYQLDGNGDWLQISFEVVTDDTVEPQAMLWSENGKINLLTRQNDDRTIGTCTITDPYVDADNDGENNRREVIAGSDPFDALSKFKVTQTSFDGENRYVLHWNALAGRIYAIWWTPNLSQSFQLLEGNITGPQNSWTNTIRTKGFHRVTVRLAP